MQPRFSIEKGVCLSQLAKNAAVLPFDLFRSFGVRLEPARAALHILCLVCLWGRFVLGCLSASNPFFEVRLRGTKSNGFVHPR